MRGERRLRWLFDAAILIGALAAALAGLAQSWLGFGDLDRRIRGPFSHFMTFAGFLLLVDLLLVARLMRRRRSGAARSTAATAWLDRPGSPGRRWPLINLALVAQPDPQRLARARRSRCRLAALWRGAGACCSPRRSAALASSPSLRCRCVARALSIANLSDESNYDRLCMLEAGARMVAERPLFGIGPNMVEAPLSDLPPPDRAAARTCRTCTTAFLQLAAERGLPALAATLLALTWRASARPLGGACRRAGAAGRAPTSSSA